jgi:hypothetical protein
MLEGTATSLSHVTVFGASSARNQNNDLNGSSRFGSELLIRQVSRLDYLPHYLKDMQVCRGLINKQKYFNLLTAFNDSRFGTK